MSERKRYSTNIVNGVLQLPADEKYFADQQYVVTRGLYGSLFLFSMKDWEWYSRKLKLIMKKSEKGKAFGRFIIAGSHEVDVVDGGLEIASSLLVFGDISEKGVAPVELIPRRQFQFENGNVNTNVSDELEDASFAIVSMEGSLKRE